MAVAGYVTINSKSIAFLHKTTSVILRRRPNCAQWRAGQYHRYARAGNADMITQVALAVDYTPASGW